MGVVLWARAAAAQAPVLDPRYLEFNASTDHGTIGPTGEALVTRYDLEFYNIGAASPFQTTPLGKPAPNQSGVIRIDLLSTFAGMPVGTTYEARVSAVGPGGVGRSSLSNQFAFSDPCATTISPTEVAVGSAAGTGAVAVGAPSGCAWTSASHAAWVVLTGGLSGSGNGTVNYSVSANTATSPRTGTVTIARQTFTITQASGCTFTISPTSLSVTAAARTGTVSVAAAAGCGWTAASAASWITVTSGASGSGNGSVGYSIAANTGTAARTGLMTIAGQSFSVTQAGISCTSTIAPTGVSVQAGATTGTIAVTMPTGCAWTATDNASWVSITSGASGSGNGTVAYSIAANAGTAGRTAVITVAGHSFGITQAGVVCSTSISPTAISPTHAGGAGTVTITANASTCAWTASSQAAWMTLTGPTSGTGSGSVGYTVAANTATSGRTGTMTIAGQTLTVTQAGAPCTFAIAPTLAALGPEASTNTIGVTAAAGCAWTATETATWISIASGASGTGSGTISYTVSANPGITPRSAVITAAGHPFTVTQAGETCTYTLTPPGASVPAAASTGSVAVASLTGCPWTATSSASWLTVTSGASGSGAGTVGYAVAANQTASPRTGSLTIGGQSFTVTQSGGVCAYTASPALQSFPAAGGPGTVTVTTLGGCAWSGVASAPWITISGAGTGSGSGTIGYTVAANAEPTPRSGTIAVGGQVVTITQVAASCSYTLSPSSVSIDAAASGGTFSIATAGGCAWTASSSASWLTVSGAASGSGNGTIAYSAAENTTSSSRAGTITAGGRSFTVTQAAPACAFTLSTTSLSVAATASSGTVSVTAGSGCAWTASSTVPWVSITGGASGSGSGVVSLSMAANSAGTARSDTITIAGQAVTITQAGAPCTVAISPTSVSASDAATTGSVAVTAPAGCPWTAASSAPWITVTSGASGTGPGAVDYAIGANPGSAARAGSITVGGQTFDISQAGRTCTVSFDPESVSIGTGSATDSVAVTATAGCAWTATPSASWITIVSGGSGTGSGTLTFSVAANPAASLRTGTIDVLGQLFRISQAGTCSYALSPLSLSIGAAAASSTVLVLTGVSCTWTAVSEAPWITVTAGQSGTGNGSVTLSAAANGSGAGPRTGIVTIGGQAFTLNQGGCAYTVSPTSVAPNAGGSTSNVFLSTGPACQWAASTSASWITLPDGNSGTGTSWLQYTVAPNPDLTPRSGTITVAGRTVAINQAAAACTFTVTPTTVTIGKSGGTATVSVTTAAPCAWTVEESLSWVTVTAQTGVGTGTATLQIAANSLAFPRAATLRVAGKLIVISQRDVDLRPSAPRNLRVVIP